MKEQHTLIPNIFTYSRMTISNRPEALVPEDDFSDEVIEYLDVDCCNCESHINIPCVISEQWEDKEITEALRSEFESAVCDNCADYLDERGLDYEVSFVDLEYSTKTEPFVLYRFEEEEEINPDIEFELARERERLGI